MGRAANASPDAPSQGKTRRAPLTSASRQGWSRGSALTVRRSAANVQNSVAGSGRVQSRSNRVAGSVVGVAVSPLIGCRMLPVGL